MSFIKKKFRNIKKFPDWLFWFPALMMKLWLRIFHKVEVIDEYDQVNKARGCIGLAWHNRLLFFPPAFPRKVRVRCAAVVSASRDGQYVADFLKQFGIASLRGSSSRQGANALLGAFHAIKEGKNIVFTPDGPRGPRYQIKPGPVMLASKTGAPILPLAINYSKYWECKGWDGFQIPKPGAKISIVIAEPIHVPPDLTPEEVTLWRNKIDQIMQQINLCQNTGV